MMVEAKMCYIDRSCTLCCKHDVENEYHIVIKCPQFIELMKHYLRKYYYCNPSMFKFLNMSRSNKCEQFRILIYINIFL